MSLRLKYNVFLLCAILFCAIFAEAAEGSKKWGGTVQCMASTSV